MLNQTYYQGIQQEAAVLGGVQTTVFDGQFSADVQLKQVEDAVASHRFDGFIIVPNDTVGIGSAITAAWQTAKIPTVTTLFPIGPNLNTLEPQVPGIVGTVARLPAEGAKIQADAAISYCADKNPCNVVLLIGQLQYPFDKVRWDTWTSDLEQHANIKVVATAQCNYDADTALKVMQDAVTAHPKFDVILSSDDACVAGAEIALKDAGIDPSTVFMVGEGGTQQAIDAIRAGRWAATLPHYQRTTGVKALDLLVAELRGEPHPTSITEADLSTNPPLLTTDYLKAHPEVVGQMPQG
jgi:ribose transport system substrate-binding protein